MFTQTLIGALSRFGFEQRGTDPNLRQPTPMYSGGPDRMFASLPNNRASSRAAASSWMCGRTCA